MSNDHSKVLQDAIPFVGYAVGFGGPIAIEISKDAIPFVGYGATIMGTM